ncbi:hypothetical protein E2C01_099669 [Portunus trituberculatus]|uniref:Secreted protein n=1 Tax=Portunus trituberculatus TaxID=210409 RepID=A0A5B7KBC5_PORTR|nr:hypothetical protein [Portunus trituberculatus]
MWWLWAPFFMASVGADSRKLSKCVEGDRIPFAAYLRRAGRTGRAAVSSVSLSGLLLRSSPAKTTNYARLIIVINLH